LAIVHLPTKFLFHPVLIDELVHEHEYRNDNKEQSKQKPHGDCLLMRSLCYLRLVSEADIFGDSPTVAAVLLADGFRPLSFKKLLRLVQPALLGSILVSRRGLYGVNAGLHRAGGFLII